MHHVNHKIVYRALMVIAALCAMNARTLASGSSGSGVVAMTSPAGVSENFDTLSNSTSPSNVLPTGWYVTEVGTGAAADGLYVVGTGASNAGGAYSFGTTAERAIGSVGSGTVTPVQYGAQFRNDTGSVIASLTISYAGEMWRRGTATATAGEGLTFAYSTDATSLTIGTFTAVPSLNFNSPGDACSSTQNVATDGNSANCRQIISFTIGGLEIPDGQSFWIRWTDADTGGSDDAVGVDDFSISATTSTVSINPTAIGQASPNPTGSGEQTTLSGTITTGQNPPSLSFAVACNLSSIGGSATESLPVTGTTFSFTAAVSATIPPGSYVLPCSLIDDQGRSARFPIAVTVLMPLNATCGVAATPIHAVQGSGATSPLVGQTVDLEGIVVGAFQGSALLNGFYLEEPAATQDGDPLTSEGIFVVANSPSVNPGDRVRIRGTVSEFSSSTGSLVSTLTELGSTSNATVCSTGNPAPPPVTISLPIDNVSDFERYEGMLVQFTQPLVVTGTFSLGTFGQIDLAPSVLYEPTQNPDSTTWLAALSLNDRSVISLDDDSTLSNENLNGGGVAPYPAPGLSASNTLRVGAAVNPTGATPAPLVGILDDRFGSYRIQPTSPVTFSNAPNPRPDTSAAVGALGGRFRVASANVLNFFTVLGSRGSQTAQELTNQRIKVIAELRRLNADVYGLSEVQNFETGGTSGGTYTNDAASDLATSLATATGRNYQFINTITPLGIVGGDITQNGTDAIRNVIIYDAGTVMPVGPAALYYQNDGNRPTLAQTFKPASGVKADSQTFTVVVNHFRSKGSACGGASDDPLQGNCNGLRLLMAHNVQSWLAGNPTGDPAGANRRSLLIGDYNAYFGEDPIQSFLGVGGYTDLIDLLLGPTAYSYNFGSQVGYLDHALVNAAFSPLIKGVAELHINADEPAALEALGSNVKSVTAQTAYFAANEFAASDHDPIVIALNPLAGDLNDDGVVDISDRDVIVANYGQPASRVDRRLDFDGDGLITPNDYRVWLNLYKTFVQ